MAKQPPTDSNEEACPACGAPAIGGLAGCDAVFQAVIARDFSELARFPLHRLTVDAYSLQHPDRYMRSAKSAVAHLIGACWALEGTDDPAVANAISRFLDGKTVGLAKPGPMPAPGARGTLTILDLHRGADGGSHRDLVYAWARDAWNAWRRHHDQVRRWVQAIRRGETLT